MYFRRKNFYQKSGKIFFFWNTFMIVDWKNFTAVYAYQMLKGNCRKKNLTTCERKISSYKPALRTPLQNISGSCFCICDALHGLFFKGRYQSFCFIDISKHSGKFQLLTCVILKILKKFHCTKFRLKWEKNWSKVGTI